MAGGQPQLVSPGELGKLLEQVKSSAPDASQPIFPSDSVTWKVNRESALFLAAARAALLQLAHPWVATAIAQHSRTLDDPIGRFHRTFRVMFTMVFGTIQQALDTARDLHRLHQRIRGQLPQAAGRFAGGTHYEANEISALIWVFATLVDSALLAYELVLPPLSAVAREQYFAESTRIAALFGIRREALPQDWTGFSSYMNSALQSDMLGVTAATRQLAQRLQNGAGLPVSPPFWYQALTIELLPQRIREEFQLAYGDREQSAAARALRWLRRIYPRLPSAMRYVGPYHEAQSRLNGRSHPTAIARLSNKLWIGQETLQGPSD